MNYRQISTLLESPIAFHRIFVTIGGSVCAGLFLSQAFYWSKGNTVESRDGWFYKTQEEWQKETGLTRNEQETARKKLVAAGLLEEKKEGVPCKLWYRINKENLVAAIEEASKLECDIPANQYAGILQTGMEDSRNQESDIPAGKIAGFSQSTTQTTTQTKTENTAQNPPQERRERADALRFTPLAQNQGMDARNEETEKPSTSSQNKKTLDFKSPAASERTKFIPPTVEEAQSFFVQQTEHLYTATSAHEMACKFHDHYTANGWTQGGKAKIKDWQACARNWIRNQERYTSRPANNVIHPVHLQQKPQPRTYQECETWEEGHEFNMRALRGEIT